MWGGHTSIRPRINLVGFPAKQNKKKKMINLIPDKFLETSEDNKAAFSFAYETFKNGNHDTLLYPVGENEIDDGTDVLILYTIENENWILTTQVIPHENVCPSDKDTLRMYNNRNDAFSYMDRFSRVMSMDSTDEDTNAQNQ